MITKAAEKLAEAIHAKQKEYENIAKACAVNYANTDNPQDKALFMLNTEKAKLLQMVYSDVCRGLHAVEQEMREKYES